jgi:putative ABC transport system permease protein
MYETVRLALRTLRANPFRTLLTMLSVTIGTFSIVVMLSLAQSGHKTLSSTIEQLGGMRLVLWIPSEDSFSSRDRAVYDDGFTDRDLASLRAVPHLASAEVQATYGTEPVYASSDHTVTSDIVGVSNGVLDTLSWKVAHGRGLTDEDQLAKRRVAILAAPLADALFGDDAPVGKTLFVGRKPYVVVGVLERREMFGIHFGFSWDKSLFVPIGTAEKRDGRPEEARFFVGLTADPDYNESVERMGNAALLANHRGVEDFESLNFKGFLEQFYTFFRVLDLIVAVIAGISLFAGGIGVMNILLVSVTERTREIGIRKAVGATRGAILTQFLTEAITLAMVGGGIGVVAGLIVTFLAHQGISRVQDAWVATYSVSGVIASLVSTAVIGVVFGALPAWRASRLDVIEALRR